MTDTVDNHQPPTQQPTLAEPHPERFSVKSAENGDYPALCNDPDCEPCQASDAAWAAEREAMSAENGDYPALHLQPGQPPGDQTGRTLKDLRGAAVVRHQVPVIAGGAAVACCQYRPPLGS
jgi:hypothetical protein